MALVDGREALFTGAPEALVVTAHWVPLEGWSVTIGVRAALQVWGDVTKAAYDHLTTDELADVLERAIPHELGL